MFCPILNYITLTRQVFIFYRFMLHSYWYKFHIFVINLAVSDLIYCLVPLTFYLTLYFGSNWVFGEVWCQMVIIIAQISCYSSWMSLSIIALLRMLSVWRPQALRTICNEKGSKLIIIAQWIFVISLMVPSFFEVCIFTGYNIITTCINLHLQYYFRRQ